MIHEPSRRLDRTHDQADAGFFRCTPQRAAPAYDQHTRGSDRPRDLGVREGVLGRYPGRTSASDPLAVVIFADFRALSRYHRRAVPGQDDREVTQHPATQEVTDGDDLESPPGKPVATVAVARRTRDPNRSKSILAKNTRKEDLVELAQDRIDLAEFMQSAEYREFLANRPTTRGQCRGGERPCPYISCEHHFYLDVDPKTGTIKINFPGKDLDDLEETCELDVSERGEQALEVVGNYMNVTRERARQLEVKGLIAMRERMPRHAFANLTAEEHARRTKDLLRAAARTSVRVVIRDDEYVDIEEDEDAE